MLTVKCTSVILLLKYILFYNFFQRIHSIRTSQRWQKRFLLLLPHLSFLPSPVIVLETNASTLTDNPPNCCWFLMHYLNKWVILPPPYYLVICNVQCCLSPFSTAATTRIPASQTWTLKEPGREATRGRTSWSPSWTTASREPIRIWCRTTWVFAVVGTPCPLGSK